MTENQGRKICASMLLRRVLPYLYDYSEMTSPEPGEEEEAEGLAALFRDLDVSGFTWERRVGAPTPGPYHATMEVQGLPAPGQGPFTLHISQSRGHDGPYVAAWPSGADASVNAIRVADVELMAVYGDEGDEARRRRSIDAELLAEAEEEDERMRESEMIDADNGYGEGDDE